MTTLVFPTNLLDELVAELLQSQHETCAILRANVGAFGTHRRILVNHIHSVPLEGYRVRTRTAAEIKPEFLANVAKPARQHNQALVFVHTHPGEPGEPKFSWIDDRGEQLLYEFLSRRVADGPHSSVVVSPGGLRARVMPVGESIRVFQVGRSIRTRLTAHSDTENAIFDRQVRAFGRTGQGILEGMHVGIVGAGGTGSVVAQQLAYLGVGELTIIDFDRVDSTNLNRLVGAAQRDLGAPKVEVLSQHVSSIAPATIVHAVVGSVLDDQIARQLITCDFIFSCTDSVGSRAILGQIAYQYFVPCIDMGVSITARDGKVLHITGRVQMLAPGLPCFACGNLLDADAVRYDLMSEDQRRADPYFLGDHEPQPAVISINSTVASLGVTMFLGAVVGIPSDARFQTYNGITGNVRSVEYSSDPMCVICSPQGAFGKGDQWQLPTRVSRD